MAKESALTKVGFLVITFEINVCSGLNSSAITLVDISCAQTTKLKSKEVTESQFQDTHTHI